MDPTLGEKQGDQTQKKQSEQGIISRGINSINSLRRTNRLFSNPINKAAPRAVVQAGLRGLSAFLAGPGLPIVIAIVSVFVFTFIIVGFGGAPPSQTNQSAKPTITLSPAAP